MTAAIPVSAVAAVRCKHIGVSAMTFPSQDKQQGPMVGQFGGVLRDSENPLVEVCAFHTSTRLEQEA
jgi:hypothetical protein